MSAGQESAFITIGDLDTAEVSQLCAEAQSAGIACRRVDLAGCSEKYEFLRRVALAFEFPEWFGQNWDAFFDCLADSSWQPAEACLLILENADEFQRESPEAFAVARSILDDAATVWHKRGVEMRVLIDAHPDATRED